MESLHSWHDFLPSIRGLKGNEAVLCDVLKVRRLKVHIALNWRLCAEPWDVTCHVVSQCYLLPDTSKRALPNPSQAGRYLIYIPSYPPRMDGRLDWIFFVVNGKKDVSTI